MTSLLLDLRHAAGCSAKTSAPRSSPCSRWRSPSAPRPPSSRVVYGVLLRPLPYPAPDRLMAVVGSEPPRHVFAAGGPELQRLPRSQPPFSAMAKFTGWVTSVAGTAEPTRATVATVSQDFFKVLGIQPSLGRGITADDARIGAAPVAVVSHRYWMQSLGSADALSDIHLRIEESCLHVVGVMPSGFQFPAKADLWVPAELSPDERAARRTTSRHRPSPRRRHVAQATRPISVRLPKTSFAIHRSRATTSWPTRPSCRCSHR